MAKEIDVKIGDKFNRWEVISEIFYKTFPSGAKAKFINCRCECGTCSTLRLGALTSPTKPSLSCGCVRSEAMVKTRKFPQIGEVFEKLTVISEGYRKNVRSWVTVQCSCGGEAFDVRVDHLRNGNTGSCGCLQREAVSQAHTTHGMSGTSAYNSWQAMKDRCTNPNNIRWDRYGGRGIAYPVEWETFLGFWEDMSEGWFEGADIDRIKFDESYSKDNCRWVNRDVGNHNKSKSEGTSSYKGVYYDSARDRWTARLNRNFEILLQKRFYTEFEAALAYDNMSEEVYGDRPNQTNRDDPA